MQVSIYKVPVGNEWVPTLRPYQFEPINEGDEPIAIVETPPGWMLVGTPHALLVLRTTDHEFTTRNANDVLTLASGGADGFSFVMPPREGAAGAVNMARVQATITLTRSALPPSPNGRSLTATRRKPR